MFPDMGNHYMRNSNGLWYSIRGVENYQNPWRKLVQTQAFHGFAAETAAATVIEVASKSVFPFRPLT